MQFHKCYIYLRKTFDPSVVLLMEISRLKFVEFFKNNLNFKNKKKKNNEKIIN